MLRITHVASTGGAICLRLEGRIVGDWVRLLEEELAPRSGRPSAIELDMAGVTFASDAGLRVVRQALDRGARLLTCSLLVRALLGGTADDA